MKITTISIMNIKDKLIYYRRFDFDLEIQFVWHGSEPLLHSPDYYWQTFDRQQEIFGVSQ